MCCVAFSLAGATVCYLWARELFSGTAGIAAAALWCFDPFFLSHGAVVTPDTAAAATGVGAIYAYWRWTQQPTYVRACIAAMGIGLSQLAKFSLLLVIPVCLVHLVVTALISWQHSKGWRLNGRRLHHLIIFVAVRLYILNMGYAFKGSMTQLSGFSFSSQTLITLLRLTQWIQWMPIPVPKDYLSGIDQQLVEVEHFRHESYLHGNWSDEGWYTYYLYSWLVKTPHGMQVILVVGIIRLLANARTHISVIFLTSLFIASFSIATSVSREINQHYRYICPIFPLLYVLSAACFGNTAKGNRAFDEGVRYLGLALIEWIMASAILNISSSMSYFNEISGGPANGNRHLVHSSLDWGQDLNRIEKWMSCLPPELPVFLLYYGGFHPEDAGIKYFSPFQSNDHHLDGPCVYIVSATIAAGYRCDIPDGTGSRREVPPAIIGLITKCAQKSVQITPSVNAYFHRRPILIH